MFGRVGFWEIAVIIVIALVVFGPNKLPELGKALGKGIRQFREATDAVTKELDRESSPTSTVAAAESVAPAAGSAAPAQGPATAQAAKDMPAAAPATAPTETSDSEVNSR